MKISRFKLIPIIVIVLLVVVGIVLKTKSSSSQSTTEYQVKRANLQTSIIISGNADKSGNAAIYSPTTGIVTSVLVSNGDQVIVGQELATVKSTSLEVDRANALASYHAAIANLNTAKQAKILNQSQLESARKSILDAVALQAQMQTRLNLAQNNPTTGAPYTQTEIDSLNSGLTNARETFNAIQQKYLDSDAAITAVNSSLTAAKLAYQTTVDGIIRSPIAGQIINLAFSPGDYVNAKVSTGLQTVDPSPLLRISTQNSILVLVKLNEIDITKVHPGLKAEVVFDAIPNSSFKATLDRIDTVGENLNAVVTYNAYLKLDQTDPRIRPTMTANVTILEDPKKQVLVVPNSALTETKGQSTVKKLVGSQVTNTVVTLGLKNSEESEITSGLKEGDSILIPKAP